MSHALASLAGVLVGIMASHISSAEPEWGFMCVPIGFCVGAAFGAHVHELEYIKSAFRRGG